MNANIQDIIYLFGAPDGCSLQEQNAVPGIVTVLLTGHGNHRELETQVQDGLSFDDLYFYALRSKLIHSLSGRNDVLYLEIVVDPDIRGLRVDEWLNRLTEPSMRPALPQSLTTITLRMFTIYPGSNIHDEVHTRYLAQDNTPVRDVSRYTLPADCVCQSLHGTDIEMLYIFSPLDSKAFKQDYNIHTYRILTALKLNGSIQDLLLPLDLEPVFGKMLAACSGLKLLRTLAVFPSLYGTVEATELSEEQKLRMQKSLSHSIPLLENLECLDVVPWLVTPELTTELRNLRRFQQLSVFGVPIPLEGTHEPPLPHAIGHPAVPCGAQEEEPTIIGVIPVHVLSALPAPPLAGQSPTKGIKGRSNTEKALKLPRHELMPHERSIRLAVKDSLPMAKSDVDTICTTVAVESGRKELKRRGDALNEEEGILFFGGAKKQRLNENESNAPDWP